MSKIDVHSVFFNFCSNLDISNNIKDTVSTRVRAIAKRINWDFWNITSESTHYRLVGSYGRGTAIKTSDIDLIVELPWEQYTRFNDYSCNGQSALLQCVKQSLAKTYPSSSISGDGQVVDVDFSDGIKFEVVPAFKYLGGGYCYPDTNNGGKWLSMYPEKEQIMFTAMDASLNGNLTGLCKMARSWKDNMTVLLPGVLIDSMAYDFLSQYQYATNSFAFYDWMSRDFFNYIIKREKQTSWFKFGTTGSVTKEYGTSVHTDSLKAYNLALEALEAETKGWEYTYHNKWRDIYGTKFPSA